MGLLVKKGSKVPKKKAIKRRKIVDEDNRRDIIDSISDYKESNSDTLLLTDISNTTSDECYLGTPNEVSSSLLAGWNPDQYACNAPVYYPYSHLPSYYYPPCYLFNDTTRHTSNFAWPFADNFDSTTAVQRLGPLYPDCNSISRSPACSSSNSSASLPFFVKLLNSHIKVCAGCRGPHMKGANCQLLPSPSNLCIGRKEKKCFS